MARLSSARSIKKVGIVSSTYYEDWHNTEVVYELVRKCPFTFIMGEVSGLEARQSKLWLYGEPLDAIFRYYPLDWFDSDPYYSGVIDALGKETSSINPASTIVTQSKAFFALLWEMARQGLLEEKEIEMVRKYIPITELEADRLHTPRFCIKPYFGREGQGIKISTPLIGPGEERDRVYQEMIDVQPIHMEQHTAFTSRRGPFTPVIGVYITGCSYAGLFVRAGSRITDKRAMCIPVVL
jgi:glutathionylspermidine synthase